MKIDGRKAKKPRGAKARQTEGLGGKGLKSVLLTIPECDSSSELVAFADDLLESLQKCPAVMTLRFVGVHQMSPDPALLIYDILSSRSPGILLVTEAWSPLIGPSALVWLAGDVRRIRSTTFMHFRTLQEVLKRRPRRSPWDEAVEPEEETEPKVSLPGTDYGKVLELMSQYLPVDQLAGRVLTPSMLRDYALLEGNPIDKLLVKCMASAEAGQHRIGTPLDKCSSHPEAEVKRGSPEPEVPPGQPACSEFENGS